MAYDCAITQALLQRQKDMFRIAAARGHSQAALCAHTGLSASVMGQYARGETAVSGPTLLKLLAVLPTELMSLLLDEGHCIVEKPVGIDYDSFADGCHAFLKRKSEAHREDSPAGRDLSECEQADLADRAVRLRA